MKKRALITGITGMVGSHLADFLLENTEVNGRQLLKPGTFNELFKPQVIIPQQQFYPTVRLTRPNWTRRRGAMRSATRGRALDVTNIVTDSGRTRTAWRRNDASRSIAA